MKDKIVSLEETVNASVETVWKSLTEIAFLKKWFFDLEEFNPVIGFEFYFDGQGHDGQKYQHVCRIIDIVPCEKLQFSWEYKNVEGYSIVTFELIEDGDQTKILFKHEGLDSFPKNSPDFGVESFTNGWNHIIGKALKTHLNELKK